MPTARVNGVRLAYELTGAARLPLVLVHGSWGSHHTWDLSAPGLARSFRVLAYDRRGHSESERPPGQGSVREDVADLAALIEHLGLAPAWVAGNSFGASIALRLAGERPDLLRGVVAHEPPLFALLAGDPAMAPMLQAVGERIGAVAARIASGDHAGAAEEFVETVALGPGSWPTLTPAIQQTFVENAPTFLDETRDPETVVLEPTSLRAFGRPALLTKGDQSPPPFAPVIATLAGQMPGATVATFTGAGHIPHVTHPAEYVEAVTAFIDRNANPAR